MSEINEDPSKKESTETQMSTVSNITVRSVQDMNSKAVDIDLTIDDNPLKRKRSKSCCAEHHKKSYSDSKKLEKSDDDLNSAEEDGCDVPCMKVSNIPANWSYTKIKDFIEAECGPVLKIEFLKDEDLNFKGCLALSFENCLLAKDKLQDKKVEGKCLVVEINDAEGQSENKSSSSKSGPANKRSKLGDPWGNDLDIWKKDPNSLYGLNPKYLKKLGIIPPLVQWVNVANFRCSKSELKEVMDLAGNVVTCSANIMPMKNKVAKVMYSHPLEAVQAVSMLNGQVFYGEALKVTMCIFPPDTILLPKGLMDIGPGMGADEKPLRDVVQHYERYINGHTSSINTNLFNPDALNDDPLNKVVDENVLRAIEAIKQLSEKGITPQHLTEALKQIYTPKRTRKFKTMCVEDLCDAEEDKSENKKSDSKFNDAPETNIEKKSDNKKGSITISDDVDSYTKIPDPGSPEKYTGRVSPCSSNSSEHSSNISAISRPRKSGSAIERLIRPARPIQAPNHNTAQSAAPNFMNRFPSPNFNRFPVPGNVPMGPHGSMIGSTGPSGPMQMGTGSFVPASNFVRPMNNPMPPVPNPNGPGFHNMPLSAPGVDITTLEILNLPQVTTIKYLCDKLAQFGQVLSLQFTRPGCAVVQFADRMQATQCFQQLNNSFLLGNVIELRCL